MFKKHLLTMLLLALLAPWAAYAQTTLTVHDGTATNGNVPVHGLWADAYLKCEMVYPAAELADMSGGTISQLTFYASSAPAIAWNGTFQVFLMEVDEATISAYYGTEHATIVYEGSLDATSGTMVIPFATDYVYGGSNLLIGVYQSATSTYKSVTWTGETVTGASVQGYSSSSLDAVTAGQKNFLPKTTFAYTPCEYAGPASISYTNNTPGNTTVTWTAPDTDLTVTGYAYRYQETGAGTWSEYFPTSDLSVTLDMLSYSTEYSVEVKAFYGSTESCFTRTVTNVTYNSATFDWTEGFGNGEWMFGYRGVGDAEYTTIPVSASDLPLELAIFDEQTDYEVMVYPLCDVTKVITGSFTTICAPITVGTSWSENFDSYTADATSTTTPSAYPDVTLPACWTFLNRSTTSSTYPQAFLTSNTSYVSSGNSLFFKSSNTTPLYAILPSFEEPLNTMQLSFAYRNESTSDYNGTLIVGYMTDWSDESSFTAVYTCPRVTTMTDVEVTFPSSVTDAYIAFKYQGGSSNNYYLSIDDVVVEPVPACGKPGVPTVSNKTNHSATLTWTAPEGQEAWQIAYSDAAFDPNVDGFDLGTVEVIDVTENPYTFDKTLAAATTYYMYVRGNCDADGYSKWCKNACSFTTSAAAPAPTGFVVTNVWSSTVDTYWTKGGGDFEDSWEIYYTDDADFAIADYTSGAIVVDILPDAEHPYEVTGLTPETSYRMWVRANHNTDGYSTWTGPKSFTTTAACLVPSDFDAEAAHTTAELSWNYDPTYTGTFTVQYRTAAANVILLTEDFEEGLPSDWANIDNDGDGYTWFEQTSSSPAAHSGSTVMESDSYYSSSALTPDNWMITGRTELGLSVSVFATHYSSYPETFGVFYSLDYDPDSFDPAAFTQLGSDITTTTVWNEYTFNVPAEAVGEQGYIAIRHYNSSDNWKLYIDDLTINGEGIPAGEWVSATTSDLTYTIEGLTMGTKYDVRVKADCGDDYAELQITTLDENEKWFVTDGDWNVAAIWVPAGVPTSTQNVTIKANVVIPSGCAAEAKNIDQEAAITIEDGAMLTFTGGSPVATVEMKVNGYHNDLQSRYTMISPIGNAGADPTEVENLLVGDYDLYSFDGTQQENEWRNYEAGEFDYMWYGVGYLYANKLTRTLRFTDVALVPASGYYYSYGGDALSYNTTTNYGTFNLTGNFYTFPGYMVLYGSTTADVTDFYVLNDVYGNELVPNTLPYLLPGQAAFVQATEADQYLVLGPHRFATDGSAYDGSALNMTVTSNNHMVDLARVRFGEGDGLEKLQLNATSSKLYIPQDDRDYAVVYSEKEGEMPVNFKAQNNGSYTISFNTENVNFGYLHLIDNLTGADVNLLETPAYSFEAKTTDYASRFRVVFAASDNAVVENFAFFSDGQLVVINDGVATLQVVDMMGRILSSETISGNYTKQINAPVGVYVLRIMNGNNVRTQKIVVK